MRNVLSRDLNALLPRALERAFSIVDASFCARNIHSGTTATVVAVCGDVITVAACGDSLAVLDTGSQVLKLSKEHRLETSESEVSRIKKAGGKVEPTILDNGPVGTLRVWPGGLAVSRTIGDIEGKVGGVICDPEVSQTIIVGTGGMFTCYLLYVVTTT